MNVVNIEIVEYVEGRASHVEIYSYFTIAECFFLFPVMPG